MGELRHSCGQQQLSELIGIDPRNAVPIIDVLVDRGLLSREIDPNDRRRRLLALTTAGRDMVHDLTNTGVHIEARFLQALDPDDRGDRVERDAQRSQLVFLALPVSLVDLAAFAVADLAGQAVPGFLHGGLGVDRAAVGVIDGVDHREQVLGFRDPPVLDEGLPQRGGAAPTT